MKTIFTFILLSSCTLCFAQDLSINIEEITIEIGEYVDFGEITMSNNGTDTMEVALTLDPVCYIDGDDTEVQICFGVYCFGNVKTTTTWGEKDEVILQLAPGEQSTEFKFTPTASSAGIGTEWTATFFDRNNSDDNATLHITVGECMSVSTNDIAHTVGIAHPNPASDFITIPYQHEANAAQLLIFNGVGQLQETIALDRFSGEALVDVAAYLEGIYFYHILGEEGGLSKTLSFVR